MTRIRPLPQGAIVPVVGVHWHQDRVRLCVEGQPVQLRHEVTNSADACAVAVCTIDGHLLGYVTAAGDLNRRLAQGHTGGVWEGTVVNVVGGGELDTGLRIRVGQFLRVENTRVGSDRAGIRTVEEGGGESAEQEAHAIALGPDGRVLGKVIGAGVMVRVLGDDGVVRAYPTGAITLQEPELVEVQ